VLPWGKARAELPSPGPRPAACERVLIVDKLTDQPLQNDLGTLSPIVDHARLRDFEMREPTSCECRQEGFVLVTKIISTAAVVMFDEIADELVESTDSLRFGYPLAMLDEPLESLPVEPDQGAHVDRFVAVDVLGVTDQ
jgi:hypothetical protein